MDKNVLSAVVGCDKAVPFRCIEPFHGACRHARVSFYSSLTSLAGAFTFGPAKPGLPKSEPSLKKTGWALTLS